MASRLLKRDEVAHELAISTKQLDRNVAAGHLQPVRVGKRGLRFAAEEVERFVREGGVREESR